MNRSIVIRGFMLTSTLALGGAPGLFGRMHSAWAGPPNAAASRALALRPATTPPQPPSPRPSRPPPRPTTTTPTRPPVRQPVRTLVESHEVCSPWFTSRDHHEERAHEGCASVNSPFCFERVELHVTPDADNVELHDNVRIDCRGIACEWVWPVLQGNLRTDREGQGLVVRTVLSSHPTTIRACAREDRYELR